MSTETTLEWLEQLAPFLVLAAFLAMLVIAINILGKKLERHNRWLEQLDLRVGNAHKAIERGRQKSLRNIPPPLSEAKTVEVDDEMLLTLQQQTKREEEP